MIGTLSSGNSARGLATRWMLRAAVRDFTFATQIINQMGIKSEPRHTECGSVAATPESRSAP